MKTPFIYRRPNEGAALIIVLALLVLVTVSVLIELAISSSQRGTSDSIASGTSAELLARSAGAMVISALVQEIHDGSLPAGLPSAQLPSGIYDNTTNYDGYTTYAPVASSAMRIGVSGVASSLVTAYPNVALVKQSANGSNFEGAAQYYTNSDDPNGPYQTFGPSWASPANTATASANGHSISTVRWNRPLLLPLNTQGSLTDFTPNANFVAPDWIYVTRGGIQNLANSSFQPWSTSPSNPVSSNTNYVVGRFAFTMYDEGGLLDVAAAGYNNSSDLSAASLARKGTIALADLTQIPNGTGALTLTQAQANALVAWRNASTYNQTGSPGGYTYYLFDQAPITGFLQPATNDQSFTSRQDLLSFWLEKISPLSGGNPGVDGLRFFTTFSRTVNAPAWFPRLNASTLQENPNGSYGGNVDNETPPYTNNYGYALRANLTTSWNRNVLGVRVVSAFTRLDNTTAQVGEPLIKTRFDLNRLGWISYNDWNGLGPPAGSGFTAADIYHYFGLTWNPGSVAVDTTGTSAGAWVYNHATLAPPAAGTQTSTIMSLNAVALAGREPDFFELLQGGILQGSLGLYSGFPNKPPTTANGGLPKEMGGDASNPMYTWGELYRANATGTNAVGEIISPAAGYFSNSQWQGYGTSPSSVTVNVDPQGNVVNSMEKYQIIQIGANIISQYTSDNYPTPIQFNNSGQNTSVLAPGGTAVTTPQNSMTFYGVKNLPYFNSFGSRQFRPADSTRSPYPNTITPNDFEAYVHSWIIFSLWNPHMNAGTVATPATLRVIARYGQLTPYWLGGGNANISVQPRDFSPGGQTTSGPSGPAWVSFPASYANGFSSPAEITTANLVGVTTSDTLGVIPSVFGNAALPDYNDVGLYVGWNESFDYTLDPNAYYGPIGTPSGIQTNWNHSGLFLLPTFQTTHATLQGWVSNGANSFMPNEPFNLELQFLGNDSPTPLWHTYQVVPGLLLPGPQQGEPYLAPADPLWGGITLANTNTVKNETLYPFVDAIPQGYGDPVLAYVDPRTTRIPPAHAGGPTTPALAQNVPPGGTLIAAQFAQKNGVGWSPNPYDPGASGGTGPGWYFQNFWGYHAQGSLTDLSETLWDDNFPITPSSGPTFVFNSPYYYTDRDYVRRLGDTAGYAYSSSYTGYDPLLTTTSTADPYRPIVLSQPFHSVGELGYTFRDDPWRSIDFFSNKSGDLALLDLFCLGPGANVSTPTTPTPSVIAGTVNINSAPSQVLAAIVSGAGLTLNTTSPSSFSANITAANVQTIVQTVTNYIAGNVAGATPTSGPLMTPADLPFVLPQVPLYNGGNTPAIPAATSMPGMPVKTSRELTVRALAGSVSTRTWNVLIDVIAQSGRFSPAASTLDQFSDKGERRYWIHVAIDRYTGKIIDEKFEFVPQ